jgi:hypothetical protein
VDGSARLGGRHDDLTSITANTVDDHRLALPGAPGAGMAPGAFVIRNADPRTTSFTQYVNNTSGQNDNFDLSRARQHVRLLTLPAGWSVTFRNAATRHHQHRRIAWAPRRSSTPTGRADRRAAADVDLFSGRAEPVSGASTSSSTGARQRRAT